MTSTNRLIFVLSYSFVFCSFSFLPLSLMSIPSSLSTSLFSTSGSGDPETRRTEDEEMRSTKQHTTKSILTFLIFILFREIVIAENRLNFFWKLHCCCLLTKNCRTVLFLVQFWTTLLDAAAAVAAIRIDLTLSSEDKPNLRENNIIHRIFVTFHTELGAILSFSRSFYHLTL